MPGQDDLVFPCLSEALGLGRALVKQRDQVLDSLGADRRLLEARRNATSEADVAKQVSELERRSAAARSVLTSMNTD